MVQLKKKVTLRTKSSADSTESAESIAPAVTLREKTVEHSTVTENNDHSNGNWKKKTWILVIISILGIGTYLFLTNNEDSSKEFIQSQADQTVISNNPQKTDELDANLNKNPSEVNPTNNSDSDKGNATPNNKEVANEIQKPTNAKFPNVQTTSPNEGSLEAKAMLVIRGNYGNGNARKQKLGDEYSNIQNKVNEMYHNGLVH